MKSYEVRLRWDDKQAEKLGVKYPGRFQAKEVVAARTPAEAINKAQVDACIVQRITAPLITPVVGIVTRHHLDNYRNPVE